MVRKTAQRESDTMGQRAYTELKNALISGRLEPGKTLTIKAVSDMLGIGVMPVRESVQQLAAEGGLEFLPNRSVRVVTLDPAQVDEVFAMRLLVEGWATQQAAEHMEPAALRNLKRALQKLFKALEDADAQALHANMDFHFQLYRAAKAPFVTGLIERLWLRIGPMLVWPYRSASPAQRFFADSADAHHQLIDALAKGEGVAARTSMEEIITSSWKWYREYAVIFASKG